MTVWILIQMGWTSGFAFEVMAQMYAFLGVQAMGKPLKWGLGEVNSSHSSSKVLV